MGGRESPPPLARERRTAGNRGIARHAFSFPGSAWERAAHEALPRRGARAAHGVMSARQSLAFRGYLESLWAQNVLRPGVYAGSWAAMTNVKAAPFMGL